jgi:hypothetical protein
MISALDETKSQRISMLGYAISSPIRYSQVTSIRRHAQCATLLRVSTTDAVVIERLKNVRANVFV